MCIKTRGESWEITCNKAPWSDVCMVVCWRDIH